MIKCNKCGGDMSFSSKLQHLVCNNCNEELPIESNDFVQKRSLKKQIEIEHQKVDIGTVLHCDSCGADSHFKEQIISDKCSYCGSNLVNKRTTTFNPPDNIIPFEISKESSSQIFKKWIKELWFAPNALKKLVNSMNELKGVYVPFWSFDANSNTNYSGERGDYYYETKTRTVNGKTEQYKERKTKWHKTSGFVNCSFRDKLELAQTILPDNLVDDLSNWNQHKAKKFHDNFIVGYQSLFSNIPVSSAWEKFVNYAHKEIENEIEKDIGGDEQKIHSKDVTIYDEKSFQVAVPIWIGAYKFNNKIYHVCINGENGTIDAERPYSIIKITFFSLFVIAIIGTLIFYFNGDLATILKTISFVSPNTIKIN